MSKVLIAGSSGVGKSTVIKRLTERGFTAYDTDDTLGTTRLEDALTGQPGAWPKGYIDWDKYRWNWQRPAIEKLLISDETVFLGAFPSNWTDFVDDFDVIIALTVDPETHRERLQTRDTHTYGQGEQNISEDVKHQASKLKEFVDAGATTVVNNRPIDEVVDEILSLLNVIDSGK